MLWKQRRESKKVSFCLHKQVLDHSDTYLRVIGVNRIAAEKEIAKENEVVEFSGFGTVKGIGFLGLSFLDRGVMMVELLSHEHNCFS